jgi:hypothetical protein
VKGGGGANVIDAELLDGRTSGKYRTVALVDTQSDLFKDRVSGGVFNHRRRL